MVTTRKRVHSSSTLELSGPSKNPNDGASSTETPTKAKRPKGKVPQKTDDIVQIWQHGVSLADLDGDTIDPEWVPPQFNTKSAFSAPFLLHNGTSYNARIAPRLPFGGSLHGLGQSLSSRLSSRQYHFQKSLFRYSETLIGHVSCVNALALSRDQGRWLASAGDDKEIHIRDMFVDLRDHTQTIPLLILKGHDSNIFSLDWSAQNKYLFSTGNDSQILYYDVEHSAIPIRGNTFTEPQYRSPLNSSPLGDHDDSVPELSAHPTNPNLLLSCDDGGNLKIIDIRTPHNGVAAARSDAVSGFSSVQWNPNPSDGNTFAAATCGRITGSTRLYDVRSCFSSDDNRPLSSKDAVLSYHTALMQNSSTRGLIAASAETNSICFDPQGHFLASSISRYHPTIYAVNDPDPLATLESTVADDVVEESYYEFRGVPLGTPTAPKKLSSCCTIKHGSFGLQAQTGKLHYAIGSDDFRAYVFEIPSKEELMRKREFVSRSDWLHETTHLHSQRQDTTSHPAEQRDRDNQARHIEDGNEDSDDDMVEEGEVDHDSEVAYCAGSILRAQSVVRPARITQQAYVLCGGRSIINTALIHPTLPLVLTAGIVSEIKVHSAGPLSSIDVRPRDKWGDGPDNRVGGTRARFLLPPTSNSLLACDSDSFDEDVEDVEDDEENHAAESAIPLPAEVNIDVEDEIQAESGSEQGENTASGSSDHVNDDADQEDTKSEDQCHAESGSESDHGMVSNNSDNSAHSSKGSKYAYRPSSSSSNEGLLYRPPPTISRESQERESDCMHDVLRAVMAEDTATPSSASDPNEEETSEEYVTGDDQGLESQSQSRLSASDGEHEEPQGTVQDFLSAMRNDPMYTGTTPLDYHHDRHIGTYSLSHVSPSLIPTEIASTSNGEDGDSAASNSENLTGEEDGDDDEDEDHEEDDEDEDEDKDDLDQGSDLDLSDDYDRQSSMHTYDPYVNDGYGSTYAITEELEERMADDVRENFQGERDYMDAGRFWALSRSMGTSGREQQRMYLFDELLRRDELRSLTAGFRKVPKSAGGKGDGSGFACGSCGRIDADP
ncbi:related to SRP40 - serine-rich protein with a role in pre-ribosome assembly or transport [Ustilago trichophora]|uniref:Related to SRP40 - serine-rich protein with a role in pre-ribosome assembly or transport n=1 Tax=Ustilago trichophora TaxID=86804 RepID=A0A5C3EFK8_9BASI|nr:related to SRP40 - serine-rich protein with a role in pre-ribosome assembly or transport [Ustilago trichophora]